MKNKKKKKVLINANTAFATADMIIATKAVVALQQPAWDEQKTAREARELANTMQASDIAKYCSQFYVDDKVV